MDDDGVLTELYEHLERHPKSISVLEAIIECWAAVGDKEMTRGTALHLLRLDPGNNVALQHRDFDPKNKNGDSAERPRTRTSPHRIVTQRSRNPTVRQFGSDDLGSVGHTENELKDGYANLLRASNLLSLEIGSVLRLLKTELPGHEDAIHNLKEISRGRIGSVVGSGQPLSAREVAKQLKEVEATEQQDFIIGDFESLVEWAKSKDPALGPDELRKRLVHRKTVLDALLPAALEPLTATAMAHMERSFLSRRYANDETMCGDRFEDIPPTNFFVSEDNYAWDMAELVRCLTVNDGVLRNPLSRDMFTETDVRAILAHPLGSRLRLQQEEQQKLKQGVRADTITRVAEVSRAMLADQTVDMGPSRKAIDEFQAYVALLPPNEQKTVNSLKIAAKDSMNGREFDSTIGQAVQDAKSNVTCVHKTGDFLKQAAEYLRRC